MKLKTDENLPVEVARLLNEAGHDASTAESQGLGGAEDSTVLQRCREEGRALMTLDVGFGDIRAHPPGETPGLIVIRLRSHAKPHVLEAVRRVGEMIKTEPVEGRLWIVSEDRVRIRN